MPTAVASAVFSAAAFSAGTSLTTAIVLSNIAYYATTAIVSVAISTGVSALTGSLSKKPKPPGSGSFAQNLANRSVSTRQPISPRRIIYGETRVGGIYTFIESSGSKNKNLNIVTTIAGHQIAGVDQILFDGEIVDTAEAPEWEVKTWVDGDVVYSNGKYYQRTSAPYAEYDDLRNTKPGTPSGDTYWSAGSYEFPGGPNASAFNEDVSYSSGDNVYLIVRSGSESGAFYYQRNATAYPQLPDNDGRPEDEPTLWTDLGETYISGRKYALLDSRYHDKLFIQYNLGTDDQEAFSDLIEELPDSWTSDHRQRGCAGVYVKLVYDNDVYPNGIPAISFLVRGKNDIYDPRTDTTGYTNNAALCTADYISLTDLGMGASYGDEIMTADLIEAANICDEDVALLGGGTEKRYTCNGTIETSDTPYSNLELLVGSMAGTVVASGKVWTIRAGAYRAPTISAITDSDIIDAISTETLTTKKDLFNGVKGVFSSPENNYQADDFPAVSVASYVSQDGGEIWKEVDFGMTSSVSTAQRISRHLIELNRRQERVSLACKTRLYQLQVGDTVPITLDRYGWSEKLFTVEDIELVLGDTWIVRLELKAIDANAWAWSTDDESVYNAAPSTNLVSAFDVQPPGVALSDEVVSTFSSAATNLVATLTNPDDDFILNFESEFKLSSDTEFSSMATSAALVHKTSNVVDGETYDVRVRSINSFGVRSEWSAVQSISIVGQLPVPEDVPAFSINTVGDVANLTWEPVSDQDLSHYVIKHSPLTTGVSWATANVLVERVARPGTSVSTPALNGTYLIKAVDFIGGESANPTIIVNDVSGLEFQNLIVTDTQDPDFLGSKSDTVLSDSEIRLAYVDDVFGRGDYFAVDDYFLGLNGIATEGYYTFDAPIDLGEIYTGRVRVDLEAYGLNLASDFFSRADYFGVSDYFDTEQSQWSIVPEIRTTQDDPSGSPTWTDWRPFVIGDYTARGIDIRVKLRSRQWGVTPSMTALSVIVTIPDETRAGNDLTVPVTGLNVSFNPSFRSLKGISTVDQDLATGDYKTITAKSATGFTIQYFDSGGSPVQRTFDYVAVGYGRKE